MQGGDGTQSFSAANLIQQIISLSQFGNGHVRVVSEDGQPLDIAPETIVLRPDGQVLLSGDGNSILPGNQFVIQYYNPEEVTEPSGSIDNSNSEIQLAPKDPNHQLHHEQRLQAQQQPQQQIQQQQIIVAAPSDNQPAQSRQYIINNSPGTQITIQEGEEVTEQIVTVDSQGNLITVGPEKTNGVQFLSASGETSGIVELEGGEDGDNRMIITEDQEGALVIG
ncbi:hypothetical protein ElyMa_005758400 [Elysia marginata]|uniref:Uncharacterized protein n=1 Tax=Elysia marginata TaxID=1093978 RepID=A0AAV4FPG3_9GAST|nr:hypothetical protein ElyMa_005758400 [Elysia marginata]